MNRLSISYVALAWLCVACSSADRVSAQISPRSITARVASLSDSGRLDDAEKAARAAGAPGLGVLGDPTAN